MGLGLEKEFGVLLWSLYKFGEWKKGFEDALSCSLTLQAQMFFEICPLSETLGRD